LIERETTLATQTSKGPSTIGTIIVIGALLAGFSFLLNHGGPGRIPEDDDVTEEIVVQVLFKPAVRLDYPVHVQVHIDNTKVAEELVSQSPYTDIITIPKGAQVSVYALQDIDGELDCVIARQGVTIDHSHRDSAGSVRCWMNRPKS
jgi:hypothetical protein